MDSWKEAELRFSWSSATKASALLMRRLLLLRPGTTTDHCHYEMRFPHIDRLGLACRGRHTMLKTLHTCHNQEFLKLLRSSRARQRLRQADLAQRLGRDQATVSKVESGVRRLDVIELLAWLHALDVDFLAFMAELSENLAPLQMVEPRFRARAQPKAVDRTGHLDPRRPDS